MSSKEGTGALIALGILGALGLGAAVAVEATMTDEERDQRARENARAALQRRQAQEAQDAALRNAPVQQHGAPRPPAQDLFSMLMGQPVSTNNATVALYVGQMTGAPAKVFTVTEGQPVEVGGIFFTLSDRGVKVTEMGAYGPSSRDCRRGGSIWLSSRNATVAVL